MACLLMKWWRCSRLARTDGTSGSRTSGSERRQRNRSVTPRMYSLGLWRLLRRFWQMRIISGSARPAGSRRSMISR
uniref:Uncharacterized protein n=1 Tax=Arundo donax TaxID=35708 RepID=A0A0A9D7G5_ARUDO